MFSCSICFLGVSIISLFIILQYKSIVCLTTFALCIRYFINIQTDSISWLLWCSNEHECAPISVVSFGYLPRNGMVRSGDKSIFSFWRSLYTDCLSGYTGVHSYMYKVCSFPHILVRGELVFIIICSRDYSHSDWGDLHFSAAREMLWASRKHWFVIFISVLTAVCSVQTIGPFVSWKLGVWDV